jgi:hypothetical protein
MLIHSHQRLPSFLSFGQYPGIGEWTWDEFLPEPRAINCPFFYFLSF